MSATASTKRWAVCPPAPASLFQRLSHLPPLVVQLLFNRGVTAGEEVEDFMGCHCRRDDPLELAGVPEAVERIRAAISAGEEIAVFGDFDADGVTATALLVQTLAALGGAVRPYIPDRVDEGYGINSDALSRLAAEGVRLVITVDCGIRSPDEVAHGRRCGLDLIVTDHHHLGESLPDALACINPRRPDSRYPFRDLAGVGVAYKLAQALLRAERAAPCAPAPVELEESDLLDLVALGTVADLVPLVGENRALVAQGLRRLNQPRRVGLQALLFEAGLKQGKVLSTNIAFALAPRLNAAGRLDSAMLSYDLLTATIAGTASRLAHQLGSLNRERQKLTAEAVAQAEYRLPGERLCDELVFIADRGWKPGIVGLVASRLAEEFYRPAVVVELGEEFSRGSARSIPEFHITQALDACHGQGLLVRHGGHAAAAGFTVRTERLPDLATALAGIATGRLAGQDLCPSLQIDAMVDLQSLDWATYHLMAGLEPFGYGNPEPLLASMGVEVVSARAVGSDSKHLKLRLSDSRRQWDAIAFGWGWMIEDMPASIDIAYSLQPNEWNGRVNLELLVRDIRPA